MKALLPAYIEPTGPKLLRHRLTHLFWRCRSPKKPSWAKPTIVRTITIFGPGRCRDRPDHRRLRRFRYWGVRLRKVADPVV